jgi:hypothetical protein
MAMASRGSVGLLQAKRIDKVETVIAFLIGEYMAVELRMMVE